VSAELGAGPHQYGAGLVKLRLMQKKGFFLGFNLQIPDTKLRPSSKDSAMRTSQIAIHYLIFIYIKLVTQMRKKL